MLTLMTIAVTGFLLIDAKRGAAILALGSVIGGVVLSSILKLGIDRPRPDLVTHLVEVHTASFPSGHAMLSAVVYLTLGWLLSRIHNRAAPAEFSASYRPTAPAYRAAAGTLDHWLTERYCLYVTGKRDRIFYRDIHHETWPLQRAEVELRETR